MLDGNDLECVLANTPFRLLYIGGDWLRVDFVRLYPGLQLVILASLKLVILILFLRHKDRITNSSPELWMILATIHRPHQHSCYFLEVVDMFFFFQNKSERNTTISKLISEITTRNLHHRGRTEIHVAAGTEKRRHRYNDRRRTL